MTSMGCRKNLKSGVECLMVHTKKHILRFEVKQDLKLSQVFISDVHVSLHFIVGDPSAERGKQTECIRLKLFSALVRVKQ